MPTNYFAHPTAIIDEGAAIGEGTKIWHFAHIMTGATIGRNCNFGQNVMIAKGVKIGDGTKVQNNVSLYEGVIVDDDVFIGPSVVFTNIKNPRSFIERKHQYLQTKIGKGASIGANATIICGNSIGDYAMIGAGCVVTADVSAYAMVIGNPAKQIGWVSEYGHRLIFGEGNVAQCPETGDEYKLIGSQIIKIS